MMTLLQRIATGLLVTLSIVIAAACGSGGSGGSGGGVFRLKIVTKMEILKFKIKEF